MISKEMSKIIKIELIKRDLTQSKLADIIGVSKQQLNNVINGIVENKKIEKEIKKMFTSKQQNAIMNMSTGENNKNENK